MKQEWEKITNYMNKNQSAFYYGISVIIQKDV